LISKILTPRWKPLDQTRSSPSLASAELPLSKCPPTCFICLFPASRTLLFVCSQRGHFSFDNSSLYLIENTFPCQPTNMQASRNAYKKYAPVSQEEGLQYAFPAAMNEANHDQQRKSEVKRLIYWFLLVLALGEKCASARASPASPVLERAGTQHLPPRNHLVHDQGHHQQQRDEQQQQHEALQQQQQCVTLLEATFPKSFTSLFLTRPIQTYDNVCFGLANIFSTSLGTVDSSAPLSLEEVPRHRFRPPRLSLPVAVPGPPLKSPGPAPSPAPPMPHAEMTSGGFASFHDPDDVLNLTFSFICVLCAAIAAGLTIGLMVREGEERESPLSCGGGPSFSRGCRRPSSFLT